MRSFAVNGKMEKLDKYCHLAKEDYFIQVIEWWNGEGFDITINDRQFALSWGELQAINVMVNHKE